MNTSLRLPVTDKSMAGEARRHAAAWANARGGGEAFTGSVALVVTELANNLALHTRGGEILLRNLSTAENCGVEILSLDPGPGVANFSACLRDGESSAGTSGIGLGAVVRASTAFDVHSQVGVGTAIRSELWARPPANAKVPFIAGAACVPLAGETMCGDDWDARPIGLDRFRVIVADGLGHGPFAADASRLAIETFRKHDAHPLPHALEMIHNALRSTRGAAIALVEVDLGTRQVTYLGLGNISACIVRHTGSTSMVSHNGTAGVQLRPLRPFTYDWTLDALLVMQSDGVKVQWQLDRYAGLAAKHPGLIAGVLYRDFQRPLDDSTVAVFRAPSR